MSFKENGFEVVRNVIEPQLLEHLKTEFEMIRDVSFFISEKKNQYSFGDDQSPNSFSIYSALCFWFGEFGFRAPDRRCGLSGDEKEVICPDELGS